MSQQAFLEILQSTIPGFEAADEAFERPEPEGRMALGLQLKPVSGGVCLSIKLGEDPPHQLTFSSEGEAVAFFRRMWSDVAAAVADEQV